MGRRKLSAISLFTGAGGLDLGLEAAGFHTRVAVEMDRDSVNTLRANTDWPVIDRSVHDIPSLEMLCAAGLKKGDADLLVGGPPCQPFSKSGYWAGGDSARLDDPRAKTLEAYLRVLEDTQPRAFLLENVPGIAFSGKAEGLRYLETRIRGINKRLGTSYSFQYRLLNSARYGVPQERERVFIVGERTGLEFKFPAETHHGIDSAEAAKGQPYLTAWDAIGDLEEEAHPELAMGGKWADLLPSIPEGANYLHHTSRGEGMPLFGWRRRYWSFLLKLAKNRPSWTLTAQPGSAIGPFHWENRRLSMRELARLQTFPDSHEVIGSRVAIQRQIGNAVPSALGELLGLEIRRQLLNDLKRRRPLTLIPRVAGRPPKPERVRPVPEKYHELEGDHTAHPGTGQGYAALQRA